MKKICLLSILLLSLVTVNLARAYPPDNAAIIYYRQSEFFSRPDDAIWDELTELPTSNKPASEKVITYLKDEDTIYLLKDLQIASEIKYCDWGLDISQGFAMQMPSLYQMKNFYHLLLADSAIQASEGDIDAALETNLTVRRMARHISNETLIGFLVSLNMNQGSNKALAHLLGTCPIDQKALVDLKNELLWETYRPKSFRQPLMMEKENCLFEISIMTPRRFNKMMAGQSNKDEDKDINKRVIEYLNNIDTASRERAAAVFSKYYDDIFAIIDKPYKQAYQEIRTVSEKLSNDAEENDDALLPSISLPALSKCYSHSIGWKTDYDAMLTALDIYIIAAKTGKLPTELPKSSYVDHFSRKPFIYEVTEDGFALKCQQEDLSKKTIHEFHYKFPK